MAFGAGTFDSAAGAAQDLFGAIGAGKAAGSYNTSGDSYRKAAAATRASTAYIKTGAEMRSKGDLAQAGGYDLAGELAGKNLEYSDLSTKIQLMQAERSIYKTIGGQQADVAGAGFSASGSAIDLMRDSASQGALTTFAVQKQGDITGEGYKEQQKSFGIMSEAAKWAAGEEIKAGDQQAYAMELTAQSQDLMGTSADQMADAKRAEATGDTISSVLKIGSSVASLLII